MADQLFDTNVLLDIRTADARWLEWSSARLRSLAPRSRALINPIIYAEVAAAFESEAELNRWLDPAVFRRLPLPYEAGFRASRAFLDYRRRGGTRESPLPDFYIGAHAEIGGLTLVTRDAARYRTYFPKIRLVAPGGDAGESVAPKGERR